MAYKLRVDLPWVASRGLKPHKGLAAQTIDDMIEKTGPNDPDTVGQDVNRPCTPWDNEADAVAYSFGKDQRDD